MENNEIILTLEEAMNMLHVKRSSIYSLLRTKELEAFKIGNVWKIPKSSVLNYIQKQIEGGDSNE